ncbi:MAG: hypothetical protein J7L14_01240, partial [Candidatus Diapherotrites archaeon]|nr:hypothetical protein [Candidatus Diapherotrites archaeon]
MRILTAIVTLLLATVLAYLLGIIWLSLIFFAASVLLSIVEVVRIVTYKSAKKVKPIIEKELKAVKEASPEFDSSVIEDSAKELGKKTGELFAPSTHQWKSTNLAKRIV